MADQGLHGLRVVSFESRRAAEMAALIRRHGGVAIEAPSMREVPLENKRDIVRYLDGLDAGNIDLVILMTGVGLRTLVKAAAPGRSAAAVASALRRAQLVARGPKPVAALREIGLVPDITVPEPNTWKEILATLDAYAPVSGKTVAVQEYGVENRELIAGLEGRGACVRRVTIYRWALPLDPAPLHAAIQAVIERKVDIAAFTSATQVYHLFEIAEDTERLRAGFTGILVASIGPVCSEALRAHGIRPDLEPEHPKMGQLVAAIASRGRSLLAAKRAGGSRETT
jgi:uroporphyrinogen-III synthase